MGRGCERCDERDTFVCSYEKISEFSNIQHSIPSLSTIEWTLEWNNSNFWMKAKHILEPSELFSPLTTQITHNFLPRFLTSSSFHSHNITIFSLTIHLNHPKTTGRRTFIPLKSPFLKIVWAGKIIYHFFFLFRFDPGQETTANYTETTKGRRAKWWKKSRSEADVGRNMKWPSANSSDRKSVFYTSEDSSNVISSSKVSENINFHTAV